MIGTKIEMQYELMGYGIPVSHIPATESGAIKLKNHNQWLRIRKLREKDPTAHANICECPSLNDVLFRRAGSCIAHPGNSIYTNLIESKKAEHTNSSQTEKSAITWSIVEDVERRAGRFFVWSTKQTCWVEMTDRSEIRQKVAMSIRDFNRESKAVEKRQSNKSSTLAFERQDGNKRKRESLEAFDELFSLCNTTF